MDYPPNGHASSGGGDGTTSSSTAQLFSASQQEVMAEDTAPGTATASRTLLLDSQNTDQSAILTYNFLGFPYQYSSCTFCISS